MEEDEKDEELKTQKSEVEVPAEPEEEIIDNRVPIIGLLN